MTDGARVLCAPSARLGSLGKTADRDKGVQKLLNLRSGITKYDRTSQGSDRPAGLHRVECCSTSVSVLANATDEERSQMHGTFLVILTITQTLVFVVAVASEVLRKSSPEGREFQLMKLVSKVMTVVYIIADAPSTMKTMSAILTFLDSAIPL